MRKIVIAISCLVLFVTNNNAQIHSSPKLFVGIVVDQMRAEYLFRFYDQFGEGGFKRLMNEGFQCRNVHFNYVPTVTGAGHASIYAGTFPRNHGIVGNGWYNRQTGRTELCVEDSTEHIVGIDSFATGVSARKLLSTNLSDELKISTNQKSKVFTISLKDRAATLPAGHMADGAFWLDSRSGNFVSSSYYMNSLPDWVINFNREKRALKYLDNTWQLMLPEDSYPLSIADDNNYEVILKGKSRPVFPYPLKELASKTKTPFEMLNKSPYGNSLLTDLAIEALHSAGLTKSGYTDLLAISYSSTDGVGHTYGPMSKEVNDVYLRLDKEIARLLDELDKTVGKGNYTLFLTADHGMADVPQYLMDHKIPANYVKIPDLVKEASEFLNKKFGVGKWIVHTRNQQFYLDRKLISDHGLELSKVQNTLAEFLKEKNGVAQVFTATQLDQQEYTTNLAAKVQNGFYYRRSGDVKIIFEPGWLDDDYENEAASSHSTGYTYDTHVPLLWYGAGVNKGESFVYHPITDIAATVSMMLHIKLPSACTGNPIVEVLEKCDPKHSSTYK